MPLHTISAPVFDLAGYAEIYSNEIPDRDIRRRINRVLTLDGGVAVNDGGYSDGDLTFEFEWTPDTVLDALINRMVQLYPRVVLSTRAGVFEVILESYRLGSTTSRLVCLPISKLSS